MSEILGQALELELGRGTVVIVPTAAAPVASVNGKVGNVVLDWRDVQTDALLTPVPTVWQSGGLYAGTGIEFSSDAHARTGFIPVLSGERYLMDCDEGYESYVISVFQYESNAVTTAQENNFIRYDTITEFPYLFTPEPNTRYVRIRVNARADKVENHFHLLAKASAVPNGARTYASLSELLRDSSLTPGMRAETLGFSKAGDFGGGTYDIVSNVTANNCTIFALTNGFFAQRVFTDKWVYLESLNVQNVSFNLIQTLLDHAKVNNVRFADLTLDKPIALGYYDLEFDTLNYTGTGYAIEMNSRSFKTIRGNRLNAPNGSGIYITETSANVLRNRIEVRDIVVKDTGVLVNPCHGHGVMHNAYEIGNITAGRRGFETYIPADGSGYSWQGEEHIAIGSVECQSGDPDEPGVGVSFVVEPHPDPDATGLHAYSKAGTITGLTFAYLGVEKTDIGVMLSAAPSGATPDGTSPVQGQEPGIKSIVIHNMRCRELTRTDLFLKAYGYLREIYIKPTSAVQLCQWKIVNTARDAECFIDAPVYEHDRYVTIGYGIKSIRGITYVAEGAYHPLTITGDTDFSVMGAGYGEEGYAAKSGLFVTNCFEVDASRAGLTTTVNMAYFYKESASGLTFKLPAASGNATVLKLLFKDINEDGRAAPLDYAVTLTNADTRAHLYSVSVLTNFSNMKDTAVVKDLGAV